MVSTELKEDKKFDKKNLLILVLILLLILLCWVCVTVNVSDDTSRIDEVRADISAARSEQREAFSRIEAIQSTIKDAQESAGHIDTSIGTSQGINDDSRSLITEGQSILRGIRERNEK